MDKVAFIYDFDKTLSPKDMQEYGFIEDLKIFNPNDFWKKVDEMAKEHQMDRILTYMYVMLDEARKQGKTISKHHFHDYGRNVELFEGLLGWFDRINSIGFSMGLDIEHIIVSSGLKSMIDATPIAHYFKKIYACEFVYNKDNEAIWPALAINYTTKTQFIYRINKGVLDLTDDVSLNSKTPHEIRPVRFDHMIYFGDGLTDVPSMKLITGNGGWAIAVYNELSEKSKDVASQLVTDRRVQYMAPANYSKDSKLEQIVVLMLRHMSSSDALSKAKG